MDSANIAIPSCSSANFIGSKSRITANAPARDISSLHLPCKSSIPLVGHVDFSWVRMWKPNRFVPPFLVSMGNIPLLGAQFPLKMYGQSIQPAWKRVFAWHSTRYFSYCLDFMRPPWCEVRNFLKDTQWYCVDSSSIIRFTTSKASVPERRLRVVLVDVSMDWKSTPLGTNHDGGG